MCKELFRTELACPLICKGCYLFLTLPTALGGFFVSCSCGPIVTLAVLIPSNITKNLILVLSWVDVGLGIFFFSAKVHQRFKFFMILKMGLLRP